MKDWNQFDEPNYLKLLKKVSFIEIFSNTYIPLLNHLGLL